MNSRILMVLACVVLLVSAGDTWALGRRRVAPKRPKCFIEPQAQFLYWNTNNYVDLLVSNMSSSWTLKLKATNAIVNQTSLGRRFSIIPQGKKTVLTASANTGRSIIKLKSQSFNVIKPPRPQLLLLVNGKEYNGVAPISKKSNLKVKVKPDKDFQTHFPLDAKYRIVRVYLYAQRSLGAPTKIGSYNGYSVDATKGVSVKLGSKLKADPPGTKCFLKVDKFFRLNCKNKMIPVKLSERELWLGFIIK